jgi:hypothetical protein
MSRRFNAGSRVVGARWMYRLTVIAAFGLVACGEDPQQPPLPQEPTVLSAAGNVAMALASFQSTLGDPLNVVPGQQVAGRREINWDGVPAQFTNVDTFPSDFFNSTDPTVAAGRKRGAVFSTPGTGLRVSDNDFADVDSGYADEFNAFSAPRTFMAVGSNIVEVVFRVAGADQKAVVKGFGVVFSDVDKAGSAWIELFGNDGKSLGTYAAPVRSDPNGFSFVGVAYETARVARVQITSGEAALGYGNKDVSDGGAYDLVVMDDYLFGEPQAAQ